MIQILFAMLLATSLSFVPMCPAPLRATSKLSSTSDELPATSPRRAVLPTLLLSPLLTPLLDANAEPLATLKSGYGSSRDSPVVVLGASGRVGNLVVKRLLKLGLSVTAVTRDGRDLGLGQLR